MRTFVIGDIHGGYKALLQVLDRAQVTAEDTNNIAYKTDCCNCEAVYFDESEWSLKPRSGKHKISARNKNCEKNTVRKQTATLAGIRRKLLIGKAG